MSNESKQTARSEDCPCTADCVRHGDCAACIERHRGLSSLVYCMRLVAARLDLDGKLGEALAPYKEALQGQ